MWLISDKTCLSHFIYVARSWPADHYFCITPVSYLFLLTIYRHSPISISISSSHSANFLCWGGIKSLKIIRAQVKGFRWSWDNSWCSPSKIISLVELNIKVKMFWHYSHQFIWSHITRCFVRPIGTIFVILSSWPTFVLIYSDIQTELLTFITGNRYIANCTQAHVFRIDSLCALLLAHKGKDVLGKRLRFRRC